MDLQKERAERGGFPIAVVLNRHHYGEVRELKTTHNLMPFDDNLKSEQHAQLEIDVDKFLAICNI